MLYLRELTIIKFAITEYKGSIVLSLYYKEKERPIPRQRSLHEPSFKSTVLEEGVKR